MSTLTWKRENELVLLRHKKTTETNDIVGRTT